MGALERIYRSRLGRVLSWFAAKAAVIHRPFMVYGYYDRGTRTFRKYTRIASDVVILGKENLAIGDHVWVGHHSILDATAGLTIEEGCQLAAGTYVFSHGSENAVRLLGREYVRVHNSARPGYTRGAVRIGAYSYLGAGSLVMPAVEIGKGCLIGAGTVVTKSVPDYSVVFGHPGKVQGSTLDIDARFFEDRDFSETYYNSDALNLVLEKLGRPESRTGF